MFLIDKPCLDKPDQTDRINDICRYPKAVRPVIIPGYKEVPTFVIKNNMRVIGMSREEYLKLLERA